MTQRSERWLIVVACVVLYALAMGLLAYVIREPTQWIVDGLIARVGHWWMLAIICVPVLAGFVWAMWPDQNYTPPSPPVGPRWARVLGNSYLVLLGVGIVVVIGAIVRAG